MFFELRRRMLRLYSSSLDAKDQSCLADLSFIQRCVEDRSRPALAACVVQLGFFELCQHILAENFWRPDLFSDAATLELMSLVLGVVADATDGNSEACEHVLSVDFQKDLFEVLRAEKLDPSKVKFGKQHCFIADCIMAVLYNVIQVMSRTSWFSCLTSTIKTNHWAVFTSNEIQQRQESLPTSSHFKCVIILKLKTLIGQLRKPRRT